MVRIVGALTEMRDLFDRHRRRELEPAARSIDAAHDAEREHHRVLATDSDMDLGIITDRQSERTHAATRDAVDERTGERHPHLTWGEPQRRAGRSYHDIVAHLREVDAVVGEAQAQPARGMGQRHRFAQGHEPGRRHAVLTSSNARASVKVTGIDGAGSGTASAAGELLVTVVGGAEEGVELVAADPQSPAMTRQKATPPPIPLCRSPLTATSDSAQNIGCQVNLI